MVAKQVKLTSGFDAEYFAGMPPLEALKMLLRFAVASDLTTTSGARHVRQERNLLSFVDVKLAHFCSEATR